MQVNILDYGAVGDGVTDCYSAFQNAEDEVRDIDGFGEIIVPAGKYLLSQPFFHWSNITLSGEGRDSVILNNNRAGSSGDTEFCILIGNFKPASFIKCVHYKTLDINDGQKYVKLRRKTDVATFVAGECVLIDSIGGWTGSSNDFKPYSAYINCVTVVDKVTGTLYLEDPIPDAVIGAKVAKAVNSNPKDYICKFPVIQNISFQSKGNWCLRFGCYKGLFKNLWLRSTDVIGGNAISHCTFENITALFTQKVVEMATYSHENIVNGLTTTWYKGFTDPAPKPLLAFGENVRRCYFTNMNIDSGEMSNIGMVARFEHAFYNTIENSTFTCNAVNGSSIEFATTDPAAVVTGNKVRLNEFHVNTGRAFINASTVNSGATVSGNEATLNKFTGAVKKNEIGDALAQNKIDNNSYNA